MNGSAKNKRVQKQMNRSSNHERVQNKIKRRSKQKYNPVHNTTDKRFVDAQLISIAPGKGDETNLLRDVGKKVTHVILETAQFDTDERHRIFERMIQGLSF